MRSLKKQKK